MPRPKVLEESRQRIAKACLYCQATKQKCDGQAPCVQCRKRGRSNNCAYSTHERTYGRRRRKHIGTGQESSSLGHAVAPFWDGTQSPEGDVVNQPADRMTDVAVPKLPHNLYDTKGRVLYLGDCAALSFLQNIQELIEGEMRLATIAADVGNFPVYEEVPPVREEDILSCNMTNIQDIEDLIDVFFAATCGIVDIFGRHYLEDLLSQWASGSLETNSGRTAILYLSIAYASQARSATAIDIHRAQSFHSRGRQIALLELTNYPTMETVQAFILICLYMLGCSQRNGAYLNLGIAISAAKSLGCHRDETNADFPESEGRLRKRIWRTLRYHDLFFCAMMGRTSAILTTDSTVLDEQLLLSDPNSPDFCQELGLLESARAFSFLERTVNEVYTKQTVPLGLLQRISQELQEASSKIPNELRTANMSNSPAGSPRESQRYILRNSSVACNYYFTMMLLTRPFLIVSLRAKYSRPMATTAIDGGKNGADAQLYTDIMHGATQSIDSAIKTSQLLHELMTAGMLFNNMPLTVAWTFVAALTVCSAYFGRLGVLEECERAIQQADEILRHFARNSPQAKRYGLILEKLSRAAICYVKRIGYREPASQNKLMPELFRLKPTLSPCANDGARVSTDTHRPIGRRTLRVPTSQENYLFLSQRLGGQGGSPVIYSETVRGRETNGVYSQANALAPSESESLLDLALSFHDLNNKPLDTYSDQMGDPISDTIFDFEKTESIWDLNWEGVIL